MDSFFGIGFPELVMILILAGIVLGPQKIRQVAFWLGRFTAQIRAISQQFTSQLNAELDALDADDVREMQAAVKELKSLRSEVKDLQRQLRPDRLAQSGRNVVAEGERVFRGEGEQPSTPPQPPAESNTTPAPERTIDEATIFQPERLPTPVPVADDPES